MKEDNSVSDIKWVGSPNHYDGRNGYAISHITLHIMVGYLTGTDSVFQRAGGASAHYGIGGNGEIHQYVSESDGSWSDANYASNNSTVSIEHEGGMAGVPCTRACMDASARLCADIARRLMDYGFHAPTPSFPTASTATCGCTGRYPAPTTTGAPTRP